MIINNPDITRILLALLIFSYSMVVSWAHSLWRSDWSRTVAGTSRTVLCLGRSLFTTAIRKKWSIVFFLRGLRICTNARRLKLRPHSGRCFIRVSITLPVGLMLLHVGQLSNVHGIGIDLHN